MDLAAFHAACLALPEAEETYPFGPEVIVYKVRGKMFALATPDQIPPRVNLKCDPDRALELRDRYESITPGYHMNKRHWNSVWLDGSVPSALVQEMIAHSYHLVASARSKSTRSPTAVPRQNEATAAKRRPPASS